MKLKKNLITVILTSGLGISGTGCSQDSPYHFSGMIGEEYVRSYETGLNGICINVLKENGDEIKFCDTHSNFKLNYITTTVDNVTTKYTMDSTDPFLSDVDETAQKAFETYLKKITEIKTAPLFDRKYEP